MSGCNGVSWWDNGENIVGLVDDIAVLVQKTDVRLLGSVFGCLTNLRRISEGSPMLLGRGIHASDSRH